MKPEATPGRTPRAPGERRCRKRKDLAARQIRVDLGVTGGVISDLSESGISVHTATPINLKPGERVHVSVPDSLRPIQAGCELAWANSGAAGLRFLVLSESSQRSIIDWLRADAGAGETLWLPPPLATPGVAPAAARPAPPAAPTVIRDAEAERRFQHGLHLIAQLAQILTRAEGVAVALCRGKEIICRASLGRAPEVGTLLGSGSGLTGECLRTGIGQRCHDTWADPRVDREACQGLGVRSLVVYPVRAGNEVIGIVEVLSGAVRNFDDATFLSLPHLAEMVAALVAIFAAAANSSPLEAGAARTGEPGQARVRLDPRTICPPANS